MRLPTEALRFGPTTPTRGTARARKESTRSTPKLAHVRKQTRTVVNPAHRGHRSLPIPDGMNQSIVAACAMPRGLREVGDPAHGLETVQLAHWSRDSRYSACGTTQSAENDGPCFHQVSGFRNPPRSARRVGPVSIARHSRRGDPRRRQRSRPGLKPPTQRAQRAPPRASMLI